MKASNRTLSILTSSIIALVPLLSILNISGTFILLLSCLLMLLGNHEKKTKLAIIDWAFITVLTLPLVSVIISMLVNSSWEWTYIDKHIRYLLGAIAFFLLLTNRKLPFNLKTLKIGFYLAAIVGFVFASYQKLILGVSLASGAIFPISFGEIMTSIAVISALKFEDNKTNSKVLRLGTFSLALFASIMAGTKGAWVAYPFLLWILLDFQFKKNTPKQLAVFTASLLLVFVVLWSIPFSQHRIKRAVNDVTTHLSQEKFTISSQGLRLLMWETSLDIFAKKPLFGVGPSNLSKEVIEACYASPNPSISTRVDEYKRYMMHVHSNWLEALAGQGIIGFLSLFLFAFFPTFLCFKNRNKVQEATRMWMYFNILVNISFSIFCLTQCLHMIPRDFWIVFNTLSIAHVRIEQIKLATN